MRPWIALGSALLATTIPNSAASGADVVFHARAGSKAPFSPAVRAGDFIFVSGQIGLGPDGRPPKSMAVAARAAMDGVRGALRSAGADLRDVVKCTVFLVDMSQWDEFNAVYVTYFARDRLPARSALGAAALALGASVEVECVAFKPVARK